MDTKKQVIEINKVIEIKDVKYVQEGFDEAWVSSLVFIAELDTKYFGIYSICGFRQDNANKDEREEAYLSQAELHDAAESILNRLDGVKTNNFVHFWHKGNNYKLAIAIFDYDGNYAAGNQ